MTTKQFQVPGNTLTTELLSIDKVKLIPLKAFNENNGTLIPVSANTEIPISIERIFYILGVAAGETRGDHAHILCSQVLVCPIGKCEVTCNDGTSEKNFVLNSPSQALYVPPSIWMTQTYSEPNSMLIVLTDRAYEEADYIRDYSSYLKFRGVPAKRAA